MKRENVLKNLICALIAIGLILLGVFCFRESFLRFWEALKDFGLAVAGLFCKTFFISYSFNAESVFEVSSISFDSIIPLDFADFADKLKNFFASLIDVNNIVGYLHSFWVSGYALLYVVLIGVPILLIIWILLGIALSGQNNDYGVESKALVRFKRFERKVLVPAWDSLTSFADFVKTSTLWKAVWSIIIVFSLNFATILIELFALYFAFFIGMNFSNAYILVYKLFADLSMLARVPLVIWIIVAVIFLLIYRRKIGYKRLNIRESLNRAFVETLCSFVIFFATMGAGKTLTMTDVLLTKQQKLRTDALEIMEEVDFSFPNFPWAIFEQDLKNRIDDHLLYNLESIDKYFSNLKVTGTRYFEDEEYRRYYDKAVKKGKLKPLLWGYDFEQYRVWNDNALKYESIFDSLRDYAQAYFIYSLDTSLLFSNYAVVTKDEKNDSGNFPLWSSEFFNIPTFDADSRTMNSHQFDNDMFRAGKKFDENNKFKDVFEFGILGYTEADKERGNMLDTLELKKLVDEVNQKNDNFNATLKMSRHPSTVRNRKFFFAYMDMQRSASINADLRELGDTVKIESVDSTKLLMPFFAIDELLYNLIVPRFVEKYYEYRHDRGDMNLTMYLMKKVVTWINNHYVRAYNTFGCKVEHLVVNEERKAEYYIMPKKIFSGVFSSDALASFFRMKASRTNLGINDVPTFESNKATLEELEALNSYFVRDWLKSLGKNASAGSEVKD